MMAHMPSYTKLEYWFIFQKERLLIIKDKNSLISSSDIHPLENHISRKYQLVEFDDYAIFCAEINSNITIPEDFESISLRKALELLGNEWYNAAVKAISIITWDRNHQYCGHCAYPTILKSPGFERHCPHCGLSFYPRISPSIIVLIHKGEQILMARSQHFPPGVYGLIAGFVEAGESIEDAVHREVKEEVGITIKNLRYFGSQAWPFPDSLMIAFNAEYAGGELDINKIEIEEAGWYDFDKLPGVPSTNISIARKLINHFVAEHTK